MTNVDVDLEGVWPHNFSMSETQAALGSMLLNRVKDLNDVRRSRLKIIHETFAQSNQLRFQKVDDYQSHSGHLLPARWIGHKNGRDDFIRKMLSDHGIKTIVQYYPLYRQDLFKKFGHGDAKCPITDDFFDNMVSIPFQVWLDDDQFTYLVRSIKQTLQSLI